MQISAQQFEENLKRFNAIKVSEPAQPLFTPFSAFVTSFLITLAIIFYGYGVSLAWELI